jgi:phage terminase large subunit-like protein
VQIIGIEKGSLRNAVMPYLEEQMKRLNYYPRVEMVTHGNQQKTERIVWALQGRMEHGRIALPDVGESAWKEEFLDELRNFPSKQVHDDMLDALAYIDQIQQVNFIDYDDEQKYEPMDALIGY